MFKNSILFLSVMITAIALQGQSKDTKLTTAMVDYNGRNYDKALKNFDIALSDDGAGLKEKNVPKGFYHRGKCRMLIMQSAIQKRDTAKIAKFKDGVLLSYKDYKRAIETDDGKWGKKVEAELLVLANGALQGGLQLLNLSYGKDLSEDEKREVAKQAVEYFQIAVEQMPSSYMPLDLIAQAQMMVTDSVAAYNNFAKSADNFNSSPPNRPDQLVGYVYYRKALLERYWKKDLDKALESVQQGKQVLEKENIRAMGQENLDEKAKQDIAAQFQGIRDDLSAFELDIYLNSPDKLQEALAKFEAAIKNNQKDYNVHVAYASMLEKVDRDKAIEIYKKAIALDDTKELAPFNLGALYNNIAKEWFDKAMEEKDYNVADSLQKVGDAAFAEGYPYFKIALKANPKSLSAVRALKQMALRLEKMEEFEAYKKMEKELSGQ